MKHLLLLLTVAVAFHAAAQNHYDVIIDEIMADPSPSVGLPPSEWIELKNTTNTPINLAGWHIGDLSGQSGPMPAFLLPAGGFVIVCTGSATAALSAFGAVLAVTSFPSLDNDGDQLFLKAANGATIHAVNYSTDWYQNELKKEGGWTLEMIDTGTPCAGGNNWKASTNSTGGTPGHVNSINAINTDTDAPQLKSAYTTDSQTIILVFNEPLDSLSGATLSHYTMTSAALSTATTLPPLFNTVQIKTTTPLTAKTIYTITANSVTDCQGNVIGSANATRTGLPDNANTGDCIINEILFHPKPNAYDYIELYNKSDKIIDASALYLANRNSIATVSSMTRLSAIPFYIFPADYLVATKSPDNLALNYLVKNSDEVIPVELPSYPQDKGAVVLLNGSGDAVDEVDYDAHWHFKLISNDEGVALERVDPSAASQEATNWHSAASTAGFGTPTYKNSQSLTGQFTTAAIEITPKVFSPDNDGFDDIASIRYQMEEPGYVANITIFDAAGRPVRSLVRSSTMGSSGYWNWDGLNDKGQQLPVGTYIIFTELFNLAGKKDQYKNTVVLARRLK